MLLKLCDFGFAHRVGAGARRFRESDGSPRVFGTPEYTAPEMLGGAYAIANNRGVTSLEGLKGICQEIKAAGHVPSVHGDESGMLGCGFCKLWINGKFEGCAPPEFTAEEGGVFWAARGVTGPQSFAWMAKLADVHTARACVMGSSAEP